MTLGAHSCGICGQAVDPLQAGVYQRVTGWERKAGIRASGSHGGSDVRLRELAQEWAHALCVDRAKDGLSPYQSSLELLG